MRWIWIVGVAGALCAFLFLQLDYGGQPLLNTDRLLSHLNSSNATLAYEGAVSVMYYSVDPRLKRQMVTGGITSQLIQTAKQAHRRSGEDQEAVLSASLVGLARLSHEDGEQQEAVLDAGLLEVVVDTLKSDRTNLQMAAVMLALELVGNSTDVVKTLSSTDMLVRVVTVLQLGAALNTDEAIRGASELLIVLLHSGAKTRQAIVEHTDAVHAWLQIADSWNSSVAVGSAICGLDAVTKHEADIAGRIVQAGIVPVLVGQVRKVNNVSMVETLTLLGRLSADSVGRKVLINSGAVSVCAQMWYKSVASYSWRVLCGELLLKLAGHEKDEEYAGHKTVAIAALTSLASKYEEPEAQNAALDALRDLTTFKAAITDMARHGVAPRMVQILTKDTIGLGPEASMWHLRSLRSVAMILAMLAVDKNGLAVVADAGAVPALVGCIKSSAGPGLAVQVRAAATAALVPIGNDPALRQTIVAAGALPLLAEMFRSSNKHEHEVAQAVLKLLAQQPDVAARIEQLRVRLE